MACPFCRFGTWLHSKLISTWHQDISLDRVPLFSYIDRHDSSSPYEVPPSTASNGSEGLEALRARNPPRIPPGRRCLNTPPPPQETREETIRAAVETATEGVLRATSQKDQPMAAACAVRAIALAVSTSQSYTAFVAAATAAEFEALLCAEDDRRPDSDSYLYPRGRYTNIMNAAFEAVRTADATMDDVPFTWPFNMDDDGNYLELASTESLDEINTDEFS